MKTVFDPSTRDELIRRINIVNEGSQASWGKMNTYQMLKHCTIWDEMALGKQRYKQSFIGKLFGKVALKKVLKDEAPLARNTPTVPTMKVTDNGVVEIQKRIWIALLNEYEHFVEYDFIHPFFGRMTKEQIGQMAYKHADHHLRQFNC
jgi:hypothetical protein